MFSLSKMLFSYTGLCFVIVCYSLAPKSKFLYLKDFENLNLEDLTVFIKAVITITHGRNMKRMNRLELRGPNKQKNVQAIHQGLIHNGFPLTQEQQSELE